MTPPTATEEKPTELEILLAASLLRHCVPQEKLPTEAELNAIHAQLARICRESEREETR